MIDETTAVPSHSEALFSSYQKLFHLEKFAYLEQKALEKDSDIPTASKKNFGLKICSSSATS